MSDGKHGQQKHVETNHSLIDIQRPETKVEGLTGHPPKKITSNKKNIPPFAHLQGGILDVFLRRNYNSLNVSPCKWRGLNGWNSLPPYIGSDGRASLKTPKVWVCFLWPVEVDREGALFISPGSWSGRRFFPVTHTWGVLFVTLSRVVGDLHLGDQQDTWKKLEYLPN